MRTPTSQELITLVDLLDEDDSPSRELVSRQLLELGEAALPYLEQAYERMGPRMRPVLDSVVRDIRSRALIGDFRRLSGEKNPPLEHGAFLIARIARPALDEKQYARWLDETAQAIGAPLHAGNDPHLLLQRMNNHLFGTLGFAGNQANYYDPANSLLDYVIDKRRGIPISLSILYLLIGRRLGLPLNGVGLPGHFMVRFETAPKPLFIDPYYRGRILTQEQCQEFLRSLGYSSRGEQFLPTPNREILARMLRNMILIHQKAGRTEQVQQLSDILDILLVPAAVP